MTIQIGDRLPDVPLAIATNDGPQPTTSGDTIACNERMNGSSL